MIEIIAYKMEYIDNKIYDPVIEMNPVSLELYGEYEKVYNECFFEMRKELEIKPYNFYSSIEQIKDKIKNIFILMDSEEIIGSVTCCGSEIDDLFVNKKHQGKGYGKQILLWAINYINEKNGKPIFLHVAKYNEKALNLYKDNGFICVESEKIR